MKGQALTLALSTMIFFGCSSSGNKISPSDFPEDKSAKQEETNEQPVNPEEFTPLEVKKYEKEVGENKLEIEYPTGGGSPLLLLGIRSWINDNLSGSYTGSLDRGDAFFKHYASQLGTDPDLNEFGGYTIDEFDVEYQNARVVTYDHTSYIYEGGAHGLGGSYGTTFLRTDGSVFTRDCITSYKALQPFIIEGLKKYFKVQTDEELLGCLLNVKSLSHLNPPGLDPWIEEDGVVFSYTPYEIAPYSSGSPRFVIPFDEISLFLTPEGKAFL